MSQTSASQHALQENNIYTFKNHLFSFSNTKQTNISINKHEEKFGLAKIFCNVIVRIWAACENWPYMTYHS